MLFAVMLSPHRIRPAPRALRALVLLTALLLGVMSHGWHHFVDHDCDSGNAATHHACVQCSALHAATEPAANTTAITAAPEALDLIHVMDVAAHGLHASAPRSARAPPLA